MKQEIELRNKTKIVFSGTKKEVEELENWFWLNLERIKSPLLGYEKLKQLT